MEDTNSNEALLKVKSASSAPNLASAIANNIYDGKDVILRAIGAGAVNQAVKAIAIAQSYVGPRGKVLSFRPGFTTVQMADGEISAITIKVLVD